MTRVILSLFLLFSITLTSCVESSNKYKALKAQLDSLQTDFGLQAGELDAVFATLNEVEAGLKSIRESENIIAVQSQSHDGIDIPSESKEQIKNDMEAIKEAIKKYQKKISDLKRDNRIQSKQFKKRLDALTKELKEKSDLIADLTSQLNEKNAQLEIKSKEIASLGDVVSNLKNEVSKLNIEEQKLKDKLSSQEKELYSVYYIVGSKSDLINAGVITKGGLFKSAKVSYQSEKDIFVKIDYRNISIINTNAKKAKILSIHPKGTYTFEKDEDSSEMSLIISDPDAFWEQTKYLVIQTN